MLSRVASQCYRIGNRVARQLFKPCIPGRGLHSFTAVPNALTAPGSSLCQRRELSMARFTVLNPPVAAILRADAASAPGVAVRIWIEGRQPGVLSKGAQPLHRNLHGRLFYKRRPKMVRLQGGCGSPFNHLFDVCFQLRSRTGTSIPSRSGWRGRETGKACAPRPPQGSV